MHWLRTNYIWGVLLAGDVLLSLAIGVGVGAMPETAWVGIAYLAIILGFSMRFAYVIGQSRGQRSVYREWSADIRKQSAYHSSSVTPL